MKPTGKLVWSGNNDWSNYGKDAPITLTGRIRYTKHTKGTLLAFEVEVVHLNSYRSEHTTGFLWWKKIIPEHKDETIIKMWVDEYRLHWKIIPEETIYECTTKSTPDGDSCCENHW